MTRPEPSAVAAGLIAYGVVAFMAAMKGLAEMPLFGRSDSWTVVGVFARSLLWPFTLVYVLTRDLIYRMRDHD